MKKFRYPALGLLALLLVLFASALHAQPAATIARETHQAIKPFVPLPIASQLQTLIGPPAPPVATPVPAGTAAPGVVPEAEQEVEPQETFGTKALNLLIYEAETWGNESNTLLDNVSAMPQLSSWLSQQSNDPRYSARWVQAGHDIFWFVGLSFLGAVALDFLFLPLRRKIREQHPRSLAGKASALLGILVIKLIPILIFIGVSLTLLDQNEAQKFPRFIALNFVYAVALSNLAIVLIRCLFAPNTESLRIIPASSVQAAYATRWSIAFSAVIIYGYFFIDVARGIRIPPAVISAFTGLLGLALVLMTLTVIAQKRAFVATLLRGNLSAAQPDLSFYQHLRLWFARNWHVFAIGYIVIGYLIAALGVENGFALMLRGTVLTLAIFMIMRVLFHATDRWGRDDISVGTTFHHATLRALIRLVIWIFAIIAAAAAWGANLKAFLATPLGQRVMGSAFSIGITVIIIALAYEFCNSAIERRLNRRDAEGKVLEASARLRTLLPMIRNTVFILFSIIVTMVVLSEAGFNIAPLLAGAGIFGVAVGFGSQALVKDFLTGLFIVIDNTIAVGDTVKIGDHSGTVEAMNVRTVRLRDMDGALHIVPYGEVSQIVNMTKDFAFAVIRVGVAYDADLNKVMDALRAVGNDMQEDPIFKRVIIEPIEILGIDKLGDSSITIVARMRTRPGKHWDVRRQFLLRMKQRFDKEGIAIPFPTVMTYQKNLPN